jgi:hypothetical protein
VPAVAIVCVVVGMTWPMLGWPYPLWVQTSAQFHQQFPWAGMIAGSCACWYATVLHAKDRFWMRPGAPRLGAPVAVRHLTTLVGWLAGAYLIGLVPVVVSTVGGAGSPDPLVMASGALAVVAVVALGYALGTVVPSVATVPVVTVGIYALCVAGSAFSARFAAVAPMLDLEPRLGEQESLPFVVFRIALFVVIAVAAAGLAGKAMTRPRVWRSVLDGAVHLALPAVLVTIAMVRPPVVFTAVESTPACTESRNIRYCVHDGNRERLLDLVRAVDAVVVRYGSKPENIDQVWDEALVPYPRNLELDRGIEVASLRPDGTIETGVTPTAAGIYACPWDGRSDERDEVLLGVAGDIDRYLTTGAREGRLADMSVAEVQQWLATHQKQLHDCTLTEDQLPGSWNR